MSKSLLFSTSSELICVPADTVVYISADGNYSNIILASGKEYVLTLQLGQIEKRLSEMVEDNRFIRIGKSLIINREYTTFINPARQKIFLSDCKTFQFELSASREALKALKDYMEKEGLK